MKLSKLKINFLSAAVLLFIVSCRNTILGQHSDACGSHKAILYQESLTPGFIELVNEQFENAQQNVSNNRNGILIIPVVVHIVYNTPNQNLPDSVVFNQFETLNADFQRQNSDTTNLRSVFDNIAGNPNIQFVLANIDPFGNPTTGITRTFTSTVSFGSELFFSNIYSDLEKVKQTGNGGIDPWDQSRYMNIWVCNMEIFNQPFLQGYATPPLNLPNWQGNDPLTMGLSDGIVMQYQYFGSNNPNPIFQNGDPVTNKGRVLTHEVGHYLGLRHIWADGGCTEQDGIDDTPNANSSNNFNCITSNNTCVDNILGVDLPDMAENFMDYTAQTCMNTFTLGQVSLMRGVLNNQRIDLVSDDALAINEVYFSQRNFIYPNPFSHFFTVQAFEEGTIELMDVIGNRLISQSIIAGENRIEIDKLPPGIYFVVITNSKFQQEAKLVMKQ